MMDSLMGALMRPVVRAQMGNKVPFAKACGVRFESMGDGVATCSLAEKPELLDVHGHAHAGAVFTLAETCSGGAMAGGFASVILKVRPVAAQVQFKALKPGQGRLTANARVDANIAEVKADLRKSGKVNFPVQVEVKDARGETTATMTVLWNLKKN